MGKLLSLMRRRYRTDGTYITEEHAEKLRQYFEWMRLTRHGKRDPDPRAMPPKPPAQRGSKVQLTVVKRRQP